MPVMKPDQDAFHYHLLYATRHPKGVEEFKSAEKYATEFMHRTRAEAQSRRRFQKTGQYPLLPAEGSYRESRYTRYIWGNRLKARQVLETLLARGREVSYDDAWAECMQYAGVQKPDLDEWLSEWVQGGRVELFPPVAGRPSPRRKSGTTIRWKH
jgi:hypothetical protein